MILSDISVTRPVFASVLSLLLIAFGLVAFERLPLREYPDIDPPVVSIETIYPGAAANVVETRITEVVEDRIAGVEGIRFVSSTSEDGRSAITVQFDTGRDVDAAANDIRDRVSAVLGDLPVEADPPEIQKVDSNEDVIMWLNLVSDRLSVPALTDYAQRYLVDRFSVLDGVARVRIGGAQVYAMRIWLDRQALAARGLTVSDVENALRAENLELPAGSIDSEDRQFTVRVERTFRKPEDFARLVLARGQDGYLVRLGDVARVERTAAEDRRENLDARTLAAVLGAGRRPPVGGRLRHRRAHGARGPAPGRSGRQTHPRGGRGHRPRRGDAGRSRCRSADPRLRGRIHAVQRRLRARLSAREHWAVDERQVGRHLCADGAVGGDSG